MDPTREVPEPTTTGAEEVLDPRGAAALLDQTNRAAGRQLDTRPPVMSALSAVVVLVVYGAIWLSARGQHPYRGPSLGGVDAAGPWVVVGAVLGGIAAAQEDWWKLAGGVAVVAVGAGSAFAGPIDVWGSLRWAEPSSSSRKGCFT